MPLMPPTNGATVNISTKIAEVGPWNNDNLLLKRGYFFCDETTLRLKVIASGQLVATMDPVPTRWPSLDGTHLHFEVRHNPVDQVRKKGERNPGEWVGIGYGGSK